MTIWYVDPINGNDASAGTSFATRCRSITGVNAKVGPALTAGDTIRIIKSADAVTTTQITAQWTDGSKTITLAAPITQTISLANSAWTATTNVTTTTSTNRKYSTASSSIAVAAAFTTGKAAYVATGALNLSGYQQVSFWINMTSGTMSADNDISLALCSDTTGDTIVNNIPIKWIRGINGWNRVVVDTGAALGSSINSIALYINQDRAAQTFLINGIFASKAASDVDALTLSTLITPQYVSTGDWWSIEMIDGTTITLSQEGQFNLSQTGVAQGYGSANGANGVGIIKREPIILPSLLNETSSTNNANWSSMSKSGTSTSARINISGGWNDTDMSTQTGDTYIAPYNGWGIGITSSTYCYTEKVNPIRFYYGFYSSTSTQLDVNIVATCISGCQNGIQSAVNSAYPGLYINVTNAIQNNIGALIGNGSSGLFDNITILNANGNSQLGITIAGGSPGTGVSGGTRSRGVLTSNSLRRNGNPSYSYYNAAGGIAVAGVTDYTFNLSYVSYNYGRNITIGTGGANSAYTNDCSNNTFLFNNTQSVQSLACMSGNAGIYISGTNNKVYLMDQTTYGALSISGGAYAIMAGDRCKSTVYGGVLYGSSSGIWASNAELHLENTTNAAATPYTMAPNPNLFSSIYWQSYGGTATDNRIYYNPTYVGQITTDTTTRHTASGVSWKMTQVGSTSAYAPSATYPMELVIGQVAVNAGSAVTASVWLYPTTTLQVVKLRVYYNNTASYAPFLSNETTVDLSGHTNSWFQASITTTPTAAGVYSYSVCAYGASSAASVYVDDFSVGQV